MKADESKDLIDKLGGSDKAQLIIDNAPSQATHYFASNGCYYDLADEARVWAGGRWKDSIFSNHYLFSRGSLINVSELSSAIAVQRPSPCAQCPNTGHKTCCCEVV